MFSLKKWRRQRRVRKLALDYVAHGDEEIVRAFAELVLALAKTLEATNNESE